MRDRIIEASIQVLIQHGLNGWTVDLVARKAGCAKGLVNYHHRSKHDLLITVARAIRDRRWMDRLEAARSRKPLDQVWQTLMTEVESGRFAAWLALLSANPQLRAASRAASAQRSTFAIQLGQALGLGSDLLAKAGLIAAALEGLEIRLLEGEPPEPVEEAYHRFWLTVLES